MIIYKDIFTDDELFSDVFPITLIDGVVYRIKGKLTTEKFAIDDALLGGNASAEGGGDEGADENVVSGVDVILNGELQEFPLDKKQYMKHIKAYMASVKERLTEQKSDEVTTFMTNSQTFIKDVLGNFKDYQFYCGKSLHPDGMLALLKWEDVDGNEVPFIYFFKHGLEAEKF